MRPSENPFRSECIERLPYQLQGCSWDELLGRFEWSGFRGAIVGPHGSGKTTLLSELQQRLEQRGYHLERFVFRDERSRNPNVLRLRTASRSSIVVIDGYEQLSLFQRLGLSACASRFAGFLVSSHRPCAFPVLYRTHVSFQLTRTLVDLLCPEPPVPDSALRTLLSRQGDVREVFRSLYDQYQWSGGVSLREVCP